IYQKKTQLEHILLRPDTYIGSIESTQAQMWVLEGSAFVYRNISYVPGLYKIFDEILARDPSMDTMKVSIDREKNEISIYNNGKGIPIEVHADEGVYVPELIFGHLLTSSNYDDSEKKVTGGRNGYGAKLCNIFSTKFIVETGDSSKKEKYSQTFSNNMSKKSTPKISSHKGEDFTRITFIPDLEKFGMTELDNDIDALFRKRAYDLAGCVPGIKVFLDDNRIKVKSFKEYVDLYVPTPTSPGDKKPSVVYERVGERWEVAFTPSPEGLFQQVSFVNSICTSRGGTHVNHVADQIVSQLVEAAKKKDKKGTMSIKPHIAKSHMAVFVNCLIENPSFDTQTKECMTLKMSSFGSKCVIGEDFMKKVMRSGIIDNILASARAKSDQTLKKTDGHKSSRISGLTKLDDANQAGTRNGSLCTLILTEGDSAKALAVSGLSVVGRDHFGVFPLRGKLLNVREASNHQIANNAEISALKQIIGLQQGKVYDSVKDLRYGHVMIMTDQDHDGSHIKGLIINFLDHFWPSLLKIPGFLQEFITPIVKVTPIAPGGRKQPISFYTIPEYEEWKRENNDGKGFNIKYYKGLGTSSSEDAKKYFKDIAYHRKPFMGSTSDDKALIDMAFNKKKADDRKEWLRQFQPGTYMDHSVNQISIADFINKELILFSMADNQRSIPSSVDGMKPGQRKILYCCFKRKLKGEIKITQLGGYVSEHSAYHHGEQSLYSTIVGMAQNFVGSNNLPVLEPRGQFGTRLDNKARFIMAIINGKLNVQNRKKADIVKDLRAKDYKPIPKTKEKKEGGAEEEAEEGDEENVGKKVGESLQDFDYLLGMPIWSLTIEKVELLKKELQEKQDEITLLTEKTPVSLWKDDLDSFLAHWEAFEANLALQESSDIKSKGSSSSSAIVKKPRKPAVKKIVKAEDDDDEDDITKAKKASKGAASKPITSFFATKDEKSTIVKPQVEVKAKKKDEGVKTGSITSYFSVEEKPASMFARAAPAVEPPDVKTSDEPKKRALGSRKAVVPTKASTKI
ncbi:DNA topoisomerase 2, partial [Dinochytrium kinnereticum]